MTALNSYLLNSKWWFWNITLSLSFVINRCLRTLHFCISDFVRLLLNILRSSKQIIIHYNICNLISSIINQAEFLPNEIFGVYNVKSFVKPSITFISCFTLILVWSINWLYNFVFLLFNFYFFWRFLFIDKFIYIISD